MSGYRLLHKPRKGKGGGVGAYVHTELQASILDHPASNLEQLWLEIRLKLHKIIVGIVYRPPRVSCTDGIDSLFDSLSVFAPQYDVIFSGRFKCQLFR